MPKAKRTGPSKNDLLTILRKYDRPESETIRRLTEISDKASAAFEKFRRTNATYKRLEAAVEKTYDAKRRAEEADRTKRQKVSRRLFNLVYLRGPTPAVVREIEKFVGLDGVAIEK